MKRLASPAVDAADEAELCIVFLVDGSGSVTEGERALFILMWSDRARVHFVPWWVRQRHSQWVRHIEMA